MKILFVGDVFSKLGRETLARNIKKIKEEQKINFIIVNGENITHGKGMNEGHYKWLLEQGANVITLGCDTTPDLEEVKSKDVEKFVPFVLGDMEYDKEVINEQLNVFTFNQIIGYIETSVDLGLLNIKPTLT